MVTDTPMNTQPNPLATSKMSKPPGTPSGFDTVWNGSSSGPGRSA